MRCVQVGNMRNLRIKECLDSIFPECTLRKIRTPKRHDFAHGDSVQVGNMRNLNQRMFRQHIPGMHTEENQDAKAA